MKRCGVRVRAVGVIAATTVGAAVVPFGAHAAFAAGPCVVKNAVEHTTNTSLQQAITDAPGDKALTLTFTGTCLESVYIDRLLPTTVIGRRTRAGGTPTLDATGTSKSALSGYAGPVTLRGFTVTGGAPTGSSGDGGGVSFDSTDVTLIDMVIRKNSATGADGGGVYMSASLGRPNDTSIHLARLVVKGKTVIEDNTASDNGGGICAREGVTVSIEDTARVRNNKAFEAGGGIWAIGTTAAGAQLVVTGKSAVLNNVAVDSGGGISFENDMIATITGKVRIDGNQSLSGAGGGILVGTRAHLKAAGSISKNESFTGGGGITSISDVELQPGARVNGNTSSGSGGGIDALDGVLKITGASIRSNVAEQKGGGIFAMAAVNITTSSITGNRASRNAGGGIRVENSSTLDIETSHVDRNVSRPVTGDGFGANTGGGISGHQSTVSLGPGVTVSRNQTWGKGGGIAADLGSFVVLTGTVSVSSNTAAISDGGGIWVDGSTLSATGTVSIVGNRAPLGDGGGVWFGSGAPLSMTGPGVVVRGNTSGHSGGGMYVHASRPSSMIGVTVSGNRAALSGGGIYLRANDPVTLTDVVVSSNVVADQDGGGIYATGSGTLTATRLTVTKNSGRDGAGLWMDLTPSIDEGAASFTDSLISQNRGRSGAGMQLWGGAYTFTNTVVEKNAASMDGGGIYTLYDTSFTMTGGAVRKNKARNGGGLLLGAWSDFGDPPPLTHTLTGTSITKNTATFDGGGVMVSSGTLDLGAGSTVTANKAKRHGGGLFLFRESTYSCSVAVSGNTSDQVSGILSSSWVKIC